MLSWEFAKSLWKVILYDEKLQTYLQHVTLLKKRFRRRCFPVNFMKFSELLFNKRHVRDFFCRIFVKYHSKVTQSFDRCATKSRLTSCQTFHRKTCLTWFHGFVYNIFSKSVEQINLLGDNKEPDIMICRSFPIFLSLSMLI